MCLVSGSFSFKRYLRHDVDSYICLSLSSREMSYESVITRMCLFSEAEGPDRKLLCAVRVGDVVQLLSNV